MRACEEIRAGQWHDQFVVDVIQGGAGTSTNMNANEVIANRALEILGLPRGHYSEIHPLEHVNMSQSTNDVYPTAVKLALRAEIERLLEAMGILRADFERQSQRVCRYSQNGAHPTARGRADDPGTGVQHLRRDAGRRPAAPALRPPC